MSTRKVQHEAGVTIVGGRPMRRRVKVADLPVGIEQALTIAALNPAFREEFLADPVGTAARRGIEIDPVQAALLQAATPEQLRTTIDQMVIPGDMSRRQFSKKVAASVTAMVVGGSFFGLACPAGHDDDDSAYYDDDDFAGDDDDSAGDDDDSAGDDDSASEPQPARQQWETLGGYTCYVYVPPAVRKKRGAPLHVALHDRGEDCLHIVQRWWRAADGLGFHLLAVNGAPGRQDLARIAEEYGQRCRTDRRYLSGYGAVVSEARSDGWAGAVMLDAAEPHDPEGIWGQLTRA